MNAGRDRPSCCITEYCNSRFTGGRKRKSPEQEESKRGAEGDGIHKKDALFGGGLADSFDELVKIFAGVADALVRDFSGLVDHVGARNEFGGVKGIDLFVGVRREGHGE